MNNTQNTIVFLASFGTSILRAKEVSYDKIQAELAMISGMPVWQVFTDDNTARAVDGIGGTRIYTVEDALETAIIHKYTDVLVIPVFFAQGELYQDLNNRVNYYRDRIDVTVAEPVLYDDASIAETARLLTECVKPSADVEYLFVGHGASEKYNHSYSRLEEALHAGGFENARVLKLKEKDCVGQAIAWLKTRGADVRDAQVEIVPLVVAWGDYMAGELYNSEDSFMWQLRKAGYRTVFTGKGLGEYSEFRSIYTRKYQKYAK